MSDRRKRKAARGFLVDENLPPSVSALIASRGYRVAHVGRMADYLLAAPQRGVADTLLKNAMQDLILITKDKRMLKPGRLPSKHRGVFVIDGADSNTVNIVAELFDNTDWKRDDIFVGRRFLVGAGKLQEVETDGSVSNRFW